MRSALCLVFICLCPVLSAQAPQQPQAPSGRETGAPAGQGGRGGRGAPQGLEPRIVLFQATPATVRAGQPVLLVWHTENPNGVAIEPGVGAVAATGEQTGQPRPRPRRIR